MICCATETLTNEALDTLIADFQNQELDTRINALKRFSHWLSQPNPMLLRFVVDSVAVDFLMVFQHIHVHCMLVLT